MEDTELLITDTEVVDGTEETGTDISTEDMTEMPGEQQETVSGSDVEAAVYAAMESYFSENVILVSEVSYADGIHKKIEEFSLTEVCLVLIVLILLGGSIFKLIGGRVWNKL